MFSSGERLKIFVFDIRFWKPEKILKLNYSRFCPEDYHPFDANNVDKYVVGDDYTPIWEVNQILKALIIYPRYSDKFIEKILQHSKNELQEYN